MLKSKLHDAASLLTNMIALDMENKIIPSSDQTIYFHSIDGFNIEGKLIKHQNGYNVFMSNDKMLYAVNSADISSI